MPDAFAQPRNARRLRSRAVLASMFLLGDTSLAVPLTLDENRAHGHQPATSPRPPQHLLLNAMVGSRFARGARPLRVHGARFWRFLALGSLPWWTRPPLGGPAAAGEFFQLILWSAS